MTLLVNGRFLAGTPVGLHRAARTLLQALRADDYPCTVLAPRGTADALVDRHLPRLPGSLGGALWEQTVLPAVASHSPLFSPTNLAPLAAHDSRVWTHDVAPLVGPQWFRPGRARLYGRLLLAAARRARTVFVPSEQVAVELAGFGVDPAVIHTLRTPVDTSTFRPRPAAEVQRLRERLGLHGPYLVLLGCFDPRKNAAFAVRVHRLVDDSHPHTLVLVGRRHRIFAEVALPIVPSVRQLGYLPDGAVPVLLAGAAALLSPSRYEGFGLPGVEAMACGVPALLSDLPAHREATGGRATLLPLEDVDAWTASISAALRGELAAEPPPAWTAADLAAQFRAALPARPR